MTIRVAAASEFDSIYRMGYDAWGDGQTLGDYLTACRSSPKYAAGTWWVHLQADGHLVSSLLTHEIPLPSGAPAIGLGSIATAPEERGKGHASHLIHEVLSRHERDAGTKIFFLFADIAPKFYERFGFTALKPQPSRPASMLMARARMLMLDDLLTNPGFNAPDYF